ncbi:MAG: hypothetical protein ACRDAM_03150 [Casimicrobium sp.]
MKNKLRVSTLALALCGALSLSTNALAQSDNPADNKQHVQKWLSDTSDYIDAKCGDFRPAINFDDTGIDYSKNPTLGTPTTIDRITAPLYGITGVCEMGDAPSNAIKKKFTSIRLKQGAANSVKLNGKTLELTFAARTSEPFGKLKEYFTAQMNRL